MIKKLNLFSAIFTTVIGFWDLYESLTRESLYASELFMFAGAMCLALSAWNFVLAFE